jgi:hypothetical protein
MLLEVHRETHYPESWHWRPHLATSAPLLHSPYMMQLEANCYALQSIGVGISIQ